MWQTLWETYIMTSRSLNVAPCSWKREHSHIMLFIMLQKGCEEALLLLLLPEETMGWWPAGVGSQRWTSAGNRVSLSICHDQWRHDVSVCSLTHNPLPVPSLSSSHCRKLLQMSGWAGPPFSVTTSHRGLQYFCIYPLWSHRWDHQSSGFLPRDTEIECANHSWF